MGHSWYAGICVGRDRLGPMLVLLSAQRRGRTAPKRSAGTVQITCSVCREELVFQESELISLSPQERALVVRVKPDLVGKNLREYVCPHCEAGHCFVGERSRLRWVGANLYQPQAGTKCCFECRKPLVKPPWAVGAYDGRLEEAPVLAPDYGLVCSRCGAVCCVACCSKMARARTNETKWVCPRCFRYPIETVFHG